MSLDQRECCEKRFGLGNTNSLKIYNLLLGKVFAPFQIHPLFRKRLIYSFHFVLFSHCDVYVGVTMIRLSKYLGKNWLCETIG